MSAVNLVRLRANPKQVRVSIRRVGGHSWRVSIRSDGRLASVRHRNPRLAVMRALKLAHDMGLAGIDLHLQWAYAHPQKPKA